MEEITKISLRTNSVIMKLIKQGCNAKQIREHYNEPNNTKLNSFINIKVQNHKGMEKIEDLKKGNLFKRKKGAKEIYEKNHYCRSSKAWSCTAESDFCKEIFIKKGKEVFTDF